MVDVLFEFPFEMYQTKILNHIITSTWQRNRPDIQNVKVPSNRILLSSMHGETNPSEESYPGW